MADGKQGTSSWDMPAVGGPDATRDPRAGVVAPVRYRYESFIDFIETQSVNVSRSGLFIASKHALPVGSVIEFEFSLADGFALLRGTGQVVRTSASPAGMGVRFLNVDEQSRKLIERIVEVNTREGKRPTVAPELFDPGSPAAGGSPEALRGLAGATPIATGVDFLGDVLRLQISPATAGYFVYNPLLNIRLGGFVVPSEDDAPLGKVYQVTILDLRNNLLFDGHGKVVAKHEKRLGIRLTDVDKPTLAMLQAEVNKMGPSSR